METAVAAARQHACFGLTSLSHRLSKQFSAANGDGSAAGNLVFSPLSIYSALSLVAAGSQGRTLRELLHVLGAGSRDSLDVNAVSGVVRHAIPPARTQHVGGGARVSGLWHDSTRTMKPAYRDVATASFASVINEAVTKINRWVAASTNNLIDSIVDTTSVDSSTRLVLTNAIYFKVIWETRFNKQWTEEDKFHRLDGSAVDAQFMGTDARQFIGVHDGFKVLRMPYTVRRNVFRSEVTPRYYSTCVLLPDTRDGLQGLMDTVASSPGFLEDHLPLDKVKVGEFWVPKFMISFFTGMMEALHDLGVQAVFSCEAELPDLLEEDESSELLILGDVLHKAVIDVNEEGTEAAAATACVLFGGEPPPPPVDFIADQPFAFFVVEEVSGAILFAGHVLDPTQDS